MRLSLAILVLSTSVFGQAPFLLSGNFDQNPAVAGSRVSLNVSATVPVVLVSGCGITAVRLGSPTGTLVLNPATQGLGCPRILQMTGPGQTAQVVWTGTDSAGRPVGPGTYWLEVTARDMSGNIGVGHFPIRLDDPVGTPQADGPTLTAFVPGTRAPSLPAIGGGRIDLTITAPWAGSSAYFLACSSTTNTGFAVGSDFVALDLDLIFSLTFPTVIDPRLFQNFIGVLNGGRGAAAIQVPPAVLPAGFPLAVQGIVFDGSGGALTNPITIIML